MTPSHTNKLTFHTENVFTSVAFTGNPLAIVLDSDHLSDQQMQLLAREFNLAETIFVQQPDDKSHTAKVRIFTPEHELPFAGHPTIGCAIFLSREQLSIGNDRCQILLEEVAGLVTVDVRYLGGEISAELTAPVIPSRSEKQINDNKHELTMESAAFALGLNASDIATKPHAHEGGPRFLCIPLCTRAALKKAHALQPACNDLINAYGATGIYPYFINAEQNTIDARMFADAAGIPEDPATGSAADLLASQLHIDGFLQEGENTFALCQGEDMGRPSSMDLRVALVNAQIQSVKVSGSSVPISHGKIAVPG